MNFEPIIKKTMEGGSPNPEESNYIHRKYERVPDLEEIDKNDFVALAKARDQWVRGR